MVTLLHLNTHRILKVNKTKDRLALKYAIFKVLAEDYGIMHTLNSDMLSAVATMPSYRRTVNRLAESVRANWGYRRNRKFFADMLFCSEIVFISPTLIEVTYVSRN